MQLVQQAIGLHQQGRLDEAASLYRRVLLAEPENAAALQLLGTVALQRGQLADAIALFDRSLSIAPAQAGVLCNLGLAQHGLGHYPAALSSYQRALALGPSANAHFNRGNTFAAAGQIQEALADYRAALELAPGMTGARDNLIATLRGDGRFAEALAYCEQALAAQPGDHDLLYSRASLMHDLGRYAEALADYEHMLAQVPRAQVFSNHGAILHKLGRYEEALASFEQALALDPEYGDAYGNRAVTALSTGRFALASASLERQHRLAPGRADILRNWSYALMHLDRMPDALLCIEAALRLEPGSVDAMNNRASILKALRRYQEAAQGFEQVLAIAPEHPYAFGNLVRSRLYTCDWRDHAASVAALQAAVLAGKRADVPFSFIASSMSEQANLACAITFGRDKYPQAQERLCGAARYEHGRIRVAYLSADFHEHATSYLMAQLFEAHNRDRFELVAISFGPAHEDPMRQRLRLAFDQFIDVRALDDRAVAELLVGLEIDIAVDLKGYTQDNRTGILSWRPAPVQVNYLGYPGSMGLDYIDYVLADHEVIPPEHEKFYSEKIAYLPDCYQVNDSTRMIAAPFATRAELGLPEDKFVFCCFNNNYKITPVFFALWMRLLDQVPGSVLWLLEDNPDASRNLRLAAVAAGIDPARLVFAARMRLDRHLARHRLADLFLDTSPYNAHTTASDALWAGLPVVSCRGPTFPARVGASLLCAIGLPELVVDTLADYEGLALRLATSPGELARIRTALAAQREVAPLFDIGRFRDGLEAAYLHMWERHRAGQAPATFSVTLP